MKSSGSSSGSPPNVRRYSSVRSVGTGTERMAVEAAAAEAVAEAVAAAAAAFCWAKQTIIVSTSLSNFAPKSTMASAAGCGAADGNSAVIPTPNEPWATVGGSNRPVGGKDQGLPVVNGDVPACGGCTRSLGNAVAGEELGDAAMPAGAVTRASGEVGGTVSSDSTAGDCVAGPNFFILS
ncbi:hypothetical protein Zmor_015538 [Zophobas morio]|uniref:Uncharacterized protein n=1 Tax=Zophobas morio TaxID=2755281 RepID=A0AA38IGY5_9CUCU|nr:hypothetical protein Zmor_015538 [Zophobas morio]